MGETRKMHCFRAECRESTLCFRNSRGHIERLHEGYHRTLAIYTRPCAIWVKFSNCLYRRSRGAYKTVTRVVVSCAQQ